MSDKKNVAEFVIGGKTVALGPLTLWSLERCWEAISALANPPSDNFKRARLHCEIIAAGMALFESPPVTTAETIFRQLSWDEMVELGVGIVALLRISGFKAEVRDPDMGEEMAATPLTEIGQGSSPNLPPMGSKAEVGIE